MVTPSQLLKVDNSLILAIGIGNVNITQLNIIGTNPDDFVTTVENFNELNDTIERIVDQIRLCQVSFLSFFWSFLRIQCQNGFNVKSREAVRTKPEGQRSAWGHCRVLKLRINERG